MTNLEAIQSYALLNYPMDEATYKVQLINADLNPDAEYSKDNQRKIELCVADIVLILITSAKTVSDDGYSIGMQDLTQLWALRWFYRNKWGLPDDNPTKITLKDRTNAW